MKVVCAYLLLALGGKEKPSLDDIKRLLATVEAEADDDTIKGVLSEVETTNMDYLLGKVKKGSSSGRPTAWFNAATVACAKKEKEVEAEKKRKKDGAGKEEVEDFDCSSTSCSRKRLRKEKHCITVSRALPPVSSLACFYATFLLATVKDSKNRTPTSISITLGEIDNLLSKAEVEVDYVKFPNQAHVLCDHYRESIRDLTIMVEDGDAFVGGEGCAGEDVNRYWDRYSYEPSDDEFSVDSLSYHCPRNSGYV